MKKFKIISFSESGRGRMFLRDEKTKEVYKGDFEFLNVEAVPSKGDFIFMSETVCTDPEECRNREFRVGHFYGPYTDTPCIRKGRRILDVDFIVLVKEDSTYLLHRYHG